MSGNNTNPKKRSISETTNEDQEEKKMKYFSVKEFRKELSSGDKLRVLKEFLRLIKDDPKCNCIQSYLRNGGSCLEILQTLELDSTLSPLLVFEILTFIILKIIASAPQYHNAVNEACRYLINNYVPVINKMINLSSTTPERKICLKLLTALVTFSPAIAKDILIHVNFHSANVELLTKHTGEENSVRDHFIHFLTAFLVDGHYPALSVLLEKKGFITSIISGLRFDSANTLCIVISAMKTYILENSFVSKTAKMKTFNTIVVREIVNLYNWKGPAGLKMQRKETVTLEINESDKSKVNECVHKFLMILCTSHKYGVIFKDHTAGLGKKTQNPLMYTVLESLDRPWEHSYASELVTKICKSCPDLTKTVWNNLKPFLEPRPAQKWLNAMNFAKNLIKELHPSCIDYCIGELSVLQVFQIIQCLIAPLPIIKLTMTDITLESHIIKQHVMCLTLEMLKSLKLYLEFTKNFVSNENHDKLKYLLRNYITKNFPDPVYILKDSKNLKIDFDTEISIFSECSSLEIIYDIFELYKHLAPTLLENLNTLNLSDILQEIDESCQENLEMVQKLQIKAISIFLDLDQSNFTIKTNIFSYTLHLLFKYYYESTDDHALIVLVKLFKNTGLFEGCEYEVNIWVNGVLSLKHFDENVVENIIDILKITDEQALTFMQSLSSKSHRETTKYAMEIIDNLDKIELIEENKIVIIKHRYLSPMLLGLIKFLNEVEISKNLKVYTHFVFINLLHYQTEPDVIIEIMSSVCILPKTFIEYGFHWKNCEDIFVLQKPKGKIHIFTQFSEAFLLGNLSTFLKTYKIDHYIDLPVDLLNMCVFYICNMLINSKLTSQIVCNGKTYINYLIKSQEIHDFITETILGHPILLQNISFFDIDKGTSIGLGTKFLLEIIKEFVDANYNIEGYANIYKDKLLKTVLLILAEPQKYDLKDFSTILELFNMTYDDCCRIILALSNLFSYFHEYSHIILDILTFFLNHFSKLCKESRIVKPLDDDVFYNLVIYFSILNKEKDIDINDLSIAFHEYLKIFPHHVCNMKNEVFINIFDNIEGAKNNIQLATYFLNLNIKLFDGIKDKLDAICEKKNILLPLLKVLLEKSIDDSILKSIFNKFEPSILKALQKPQKVGQYFHQYYHGILILLDRFMLLDKYEVYTQKIHKFEVSEIFHASMLGVIYKKYLNNNLSAKQIESIFLTLIHLQVKLCKKDLLTDNDAKKLNEIAQIFNDVLSNINILNLDLQSISANDTLKLYFKYCLKFGISGQVILLRILQNLIKNIANYMKREDAELIMTMLLSHSEFLEHVLGEKTEVKLEILTLFLIFCQNWDVLMERNHLPVLLASYKAMVDKCDRTILAILKMYEAHADKTKFYDFKPFLWGKAAANHYSVRLSMENILWRQPKMGDILDILQEDLVRSTIRNYPLTDTLLCDEIISVDVEDTKSYDLMFLLSVFSQLLAPEQQVQTYKFTRSGALSLTVVALSCQDKKVRQAACHVLARFYFHLEARQTGKDNLLWIRYMEAVCKGTAIITDFKLNNFSAVYLARMALVLTQPNHVMYLPLSKHLTAKSALDFSTVPELYTFLHSCDINFKEHRTFTLELLRDGLRTERDFTDFWRSMAFKLFSELYSSCISDFDTKMLIWDIILSCCRIPLGVKVLCENNSLLMQIYTEVKNIVNNAINDRGKDILYLDKIIIIILQIIGILSDKHSNTMVFSILKLIFSCKLFHNLLQNNEKIFFKILYLIFCRYPKLFSVETFNILLNQSNDLYSRYLFDYGCMYINKTNVDENSKHYYLRLMIIEYKS